MITLMASQVIAAVSSGVESAEKPVVTQFDLSHYRKAVSSAVEVQVGTVGVSQTVQSRRAFDAERTRAAALNSGLASAEPSSAKLTRPASNAASHSAERSSPLCTSRRCASSYSAQGTMREARNRAGSEMPVIGHRPSQ